MTSHKGKFITIEGIEGVGKSSNLKFIADIIKTKDKPVLMTREPGGTPMAEAIRRILLEEFSETTLPKTELLLLFAGRLQHVEHVIKPALEKGIWVICDRFTDATRAYQGAGRGIAFAEIEFINQWTLGDFAPDCTIILDAPVNVAFSRIHKKRDLDRFEKERSTFFEKIRKHYLHTAKENPHRYHVVDAARELVEVQKSLKEIVNNLCK